MLTVTVDVESYYSSEYSLQKMTPVEYILSPLWETIGWAVKVGNEPSKWMTHHEFSGFLTQLPGRVAMISHNALFDMCVLAWRYGYVPSLMIDTLGMARARLAHRLRGLSLERVARHLGLGAKGGTVHKVIGMRLDDIRMAGFYDEYASYSCTDADLCRGIFDRLMGEGFPLRELEIMDMVLRCAVQPQFVLNNSLLYEHLAAIQAAKAALLERVRLHEHDDMGGKSARDILMSNDMFALALQGMGVDPPRKISLTTGKETWAFAKTDAEFIGLEEHEDPDVQALVAARLGTKSTIEETRTERLISISNLTWPGNGAQGLMPVPLRYSGAHTHRLSGDWKLNLQNLPSRSNSSIRKSLGAPEGHVVVGVDASQIEARLAAWFCGATLMVTAFANKSDVYSQFASTVFGYPVNKKEHPVERFVGKTGVLGLQYGLGPPTFQNTVALQSKAQLGQEVRLSDEESRKTVYTYRNTYYQIPAMWRLLDSLLPRMTARGFRQELGPVVFEHEKITLPSGLALHYHNLQNVGGEWRFEHSGAPKYIYGGKMLENIIQALARICVMDTAQRVKQRLGRHASTIRLALQVHDELVYIPPTEIAEVLRDMVIEEMCRPPQWGLDIPLEAEGAIGKSFGHAK